MHTDIQRTTTWTGQTEDRESALTREWLVTNALGGYASGTISGVVTRRYHGLLVAALPAPFGRTVMFNHLHERLQLANGVTIDLSDQDATDRRSSVPALPFLKEFQLDMGLPVWRYRIDDVLLEKSIFMPHRHNTVYINYRVLEGNQPVTLNLRPSFHFRPQEAAVDRIFVDVCEYELAVRGDHYQLHGGNFPPLTMQVVGGQTSFTIDRRRRNDIFFRLEEQRGYAAVGEHWSPGIFDLRLEPGQEATLVATTENMVDVATISPRNARATEISRRKDLLKIARPELRTGMAAELVLAADQFIITPAGRAEEVAPGHAARGEVTTIIAGYHWFTDWGRDTMISLEGLALVTGRHREASYILRTFASYVRDGLIPNMFPEHDKDGLYHTADASLWFFYALHRHLQATQDRETLRAILPRLIDIVDHHLRGTRFNIGIDPGDGLMRQGQEGYQLTWMDAKVNDWVVTPRRGKAVELNALWYNALRLLEGWITEEQGAQAAQYLRDHADKAQQSFNQRFWFAEGGYLYDVIDGEAGDDSACRPNQIFAIALDHPVLIRERWQSVFNVVKENLLTPFGLRSLSPDHPDYKATYFGDLLTRDAAYHQGTVWGWLIGPFIDTWLKLAPDDTAGARELLTQFETHLNEAGVGSISEVFDAEAPFTARGCMAQAWSVAEVLRCWAKCSVAPSV